MQAALTNIIDTAENPVPRGATVHVVTCADGVGLRVCVWPHSMPRGTICVMPGRSEFIEKYFEFVADLQARGFAVVAFDWRGQGGSQRLLRDRLKGHVDHFSHYRADLQAVLGFMAENACPQPWYGVAHSMGGAVAIDASVHGEGRLERIIASAPLVGLYGVALHGWESRAVKALNLMGLGGMYLPDSRSHAPSAFAPFAGNPLTSDPQRYDRAAAVLIAGPDLAVGAPTVGWTAAAFRLTQTMALEDYGLNAAVPSLLVNAGSDTIVSAAAAETLAGRMRGSRAITLPGARHEILMERDSIRAQFLAAFDAFCPGRPYAMTA